MSFASNMDEIYNDVYKCLTSNGVNVKENCIYMESSSGETVVKAITEDTPPRQFSLRLSDKFIVCEDESTIKYDISPFKKKMQFSSSSEVELLARRKRYYSYLVEIGEMTEDEMEEELKS